MSSNCAQISWLRKYLACCYLVRSFLLLLEGSLIRIIDQTKLMGNKLLEYPPIDDIKIAWIGFVSCRVKLKYIFCLVCPLDQLLNDLPCLCFFILSHKWTWALSLQPEHLPSILPFTLCIIQWWWLKINESWVPHEFAQTPFLDTKIFELYK